jgi:hypothetical protein
VETQTLKQRSKEPVKQFSVFTANKLGRLHDLISLLKSHEIHVLALTVLDTTDSSIVRLVVDDPDKARAILTERQFAFTESELLVVEIDSETHLTDALQALLEAEINIHYLYFFLTRSQDKSALALSLEDLSVAEEALQRHQFTVLHQGDISR